MPRHLSNGEQIQRINGVDLCYETFGNPADPAVLLVAGAAASMLWWDAELCERIAVGGRFVIRYDNRDTGRSVSYPPGQPGYTLTDLTEDALGILDAHDVRRGHIVGQSMFGGVALVAGVDHPERVASLTFVSSSTGDPDLPPPSDSLRNAPPPPDFDDPSSVVDHVLAGARLYSGGSPLFDESAMRAMIERDVARTRDFGATLANHYLADIDGPVNGSYRDITAPTLVVHGDRDPVFPLAHGEALRDAIPGAELVVLRGAGHEVPKPLWDTFVSVLLRHTGRAD